MIKRLLPADAQECNGYGETLSCDAFERCHSPLRSNRLTLQECTERWNLSAKVSACGCGGCERNRLQGDRPLVGVRGFPSPKVGTWGTRLVGSGQGRARRLGFVVSPVSKSRPGAPSSQRSGLAKRARTIWECRLCVSACCASLATLREFRGPGSWRSCGCACSSCSRS
jgi:hypothetical protein